MLKLKTTKSNPLPFNFQVGDTVAVTTKVKEDDRTRLQKFEGVVIGIQGKADGKTFIVRRVAVNEIGVERIFPVYSPVIDSVVVVKHGHPRRSKLFYLRGRKGKAATFVKA